MKPILYLIGFIITLIVLLPLPFSCTTLYLLNLIVFFYCVDDAKTKDTTTATSSATDKLTSVAQSK